MPQHKKGKKTRKYDRNRKKCEKYKLTNVREKNKDRRIAKVKKRQEYFDRRNKEMAEGIRPLTRTFLRRTT